MKSIKLTDTRRSYGNYKAALRLIAWFGTIIWSLPVSSATHTIDCLIWHDNLEWHTVWMQEKRGKALKWTGQLIDLAWAGHWIVPQLYFSWAICSSDYYAVLHRYNPHSLLRWNFWSHLARYLETKQRQIFYIYILKRVNNTIKQKHTCTGNSSTRKCPELLSKRFLPRIIVTFVLPITLAFPNQSRPESSQSVKALE